MQNNSNYKIDWKNIFSFIYETGKITDLNNYSYYFLQKLNKLIPFYAANFFLFDENEEIIESPVCLNVNNQALNAYNSYYYQIDAIREIAFNQIEPSRSTDLMDYKKWVKTEYFTDFLKKNNLYYSCGIDIHHQERLLGTISLFRDKNDNDFSLKDLLYLKLISQQCSNQLNKLFIINNLERKIQKNRHGLLEKAGQKFQLTEREKELLKLLIEGKNNQEIAQDLFISINTVKKHLSHIFNKTEVKNRTELVSLIYKVR
ncbi:regulatory LuxR family protein [Halanaerobium saccharolyticum]|uniref:Regulatory LuxR family protein n=1 Tax=Halanaerobium saccharolyticum TaxID=43595 RepID=A0A4R6LXW9_9FIRM|nr:response regulator transcription factor [Halanaerobium saccharolyticum]TDO92259.1 regulatory LuxR family protein [Halanaerobium saccharolyticum]